MSSRIVMPALVVIFVIIDQLTKWLVEEHLPMQQALEIVPFFSLYRTHNTGIAFSMLSSLGPSGLIVITLAVIGLMLFLWSRLEAHQRLASLGFGLIVAGAIGNLIDRALLGYVVDFFLFHTQSWAFAVFNVADAFISVGAIAIIIDELFSLGRKEENPA